MNAKRQKQAEAALPRNVKTQRVTRQEPESVELDDVSPGGSGGGGGREPPRQPCKIELFPFWRRKKVIERAAQKFIRSGLNRDAGFMMGLSDPVWNAAECYGLDTGKSEFDEHCRLFLNAMIRRAGEILEARRAAGDGVAAEMLARNGR
jgi:hypothetical protein